MKRLLSFRVELTLVCAMVFVAAWLRFTLLDQAEFRWDQAEISKWALNMARQCEITWIGPISSTKLDTFPIAIWLYAIPYAVSPSPIIATGFVAVLNLATVVGCYALTRRWFGRQAALVATLLYAVAPWAVVYSRRIWHTVLLPPFGLLHAATGWLAFVRGRRWALPAHGLALAALVQIHFSALSFVLLTILWILAFRRRIDRRVALFTALLVALAFVPYFVVDAQKGWRNARLFAELVQTPATMDADAAVATWATTTGLKLDWLTGPDRYPDFLAVTPNARWLFFVEGGLAVVGGSVALWRVARRARTGLDAETSVALVVATWLAMPALFLTRHSTRVAPHYFTTTFPAQFILIGWLSAQAWRCSGRMARVVQGILAVLVAALALAQTYETTSVLQFVATHDTGWYGTPVAHEIQAVQTATELSQEVGAAEVIVLSEGDEPRMFEMPNVADVLLYDAPHRSVDIRTALILPATPAVYWATYDMTPGEALLASFTPEVKEARIPLRERTRSFRFYRWPGGEPPLPGLHPLPDGPLTWANGAQLVGYRLEGNLCPGGEIHWELVWRPTQTRAEDVWYHWFNHLLDGQGQMVGQRDGPSVLPAYWRAGDTILNWFDFQIPLDAAPGGYAMRVGMYAYPVIENVPVLGSNGALEGEWVEIRPLPVLDSGNE
jgi:4-amino-4-deoxy-L-arabinose transferase-like glycosyltransferase